MIHVRSLIVSQIDQTQKELPQTRQILYLIRHKQERKRQVNYHYPHPWTSLVPFFLSMHITSFSWGVRLQNLAEAEHFSWNFLLVPRPSNFSPTYLENEALPPYFYSVLQHNTYEANLCLSHILELVCGQLSLHLLINAHIRILYITVHSPPCEKPH